MLQTITKQWLWTVAAALLTVLLFRPQPAHAQGTVNIDLCATTGMITLPGSSTATPIWGYVDCAATDPLAAPGGPTIDVIAGDTVNVTLHNNLPGATMTALFFQGQPLIPDLTGIAPGAVTTYSFIPAHAGTFIYEAGLIPGTQYQVALGLYGALVVRPATAGQAYNAATTRYDDEAVLILSELDPALNSSADPSLFDLRDYKPKYGLINGQPYPNTLNIDTAADHQLLVRYINAGLQHHSMALLGLHQTVIAMDGSPLAYSHRMVAETIAPGQSADVIVTIPNATLAPDGAKFPLYDGDLLLHNSSSAGMGGRLTGSNPAGYGGMLTFLAVGTSTGGGTDTAGPATTAVLLSPNPTTGSGDVTLDATISDMGLGDATITAAEYFIDTVGSPGSGATMSGVPGGVTATVQATISAATLATLAAGNHTIYVEGMDANGNWGATNFAVLNLDKVGPATSGLEVTPNPSNGSGNVTLSGTASDATTGNSNVVAAEYTMDGSCPFVACDVDLNLSAPVASLSALIPVDALSEGTHIVTVRSQDALGNWGDYAEPVELIIDQTGPTAYVVNAMPNPNNGAQGLNSQLAVVRVTATFSDVLGAGVLAMAAENPSTASTNVDSNTADEANHLYLPLVAANPAPTNAESVNAAAVIPGTRYIKGGEGFIDSVGANGSGFPFVASDGLFDEGNEPAYADIPLTTIAQLSDGNHTIYVHGQDAAGNWGDALSSSVILVIDKNAPTISSATIAPDPTNGAATVLLTVTANDNAGGTGLNGGDYWIDGTTTPPAVTTAFSGLTATIDISTLADGVHTVSVRVQDVAGNWSAVVTVAFTVSTPSPSIYFSTTGNTNPPGLTNGDNADIYFWNGAAFSRAINASGGGSLGLPGGANVDGFDRVDNTHFYLSFNGQVNVPGLGNVQDEDIVFYNAGVWSLYFDGSAQGLPSGSFDLDAINIVGAGGPGNVYFSTDNNNTPPGAGGGGDNADIYRWNGGNSYTRVVNATGGAGNLGLPGSANVDGLVWVDATHFYMSFSGNTTNVPGLGNVEDEDVVYYNAGLWSVYFDGTAVGLGTSGNLDIDAFDLP
ncbi:MAG: multicopper oxidase domain-containing protein [Caldilineaceae bacterium]